MTNEQAKALAEKVWGPTVMLSWESPVDATLLARPYKIGMWDNRNQKWAWLYWGDSWESAFKAAGVEVCPACNGDGKYRVLKYPHEHETVMTGVEFDEFPCIPCNGLGYRLLEKKP